MLYQFLNDTLEYTQKYIDGEEKVLDETFGHSIPLDEKSNSSDDNDLLNIGDSCSQMIFTQCVDVKPPIVNKTIDDLGNKEIRITGNGVRERNKVNFIGDAVTTTTRYKNMGVQCDLKSMSQTRNVCVQTEKTIGKDENTNNDKRDKKKTRKPYLRLGLSKKRKT